MFNPYTMQPSYPYMQGPGASQFQYQPAQQPSSQTQLRWVGGIAEVNGATLQPGESCVFMYTGENAFAMKTVGMDGVPTVRSKEAAMSCNCKNRALAQAVFDNAAVQAVPAGGIMQPASIATSTDCIELVGGEIRINRPGDYKVSVNATMGTAAAGTVEVQLFRNGSPVPGAHALETAAAADDVVSLTFNDLITVDCCGGTVISVRAVAAANMRVLNVIVEEV